MRAVFLFFLGVVLAAGVAILGYGVWMLVEVLRAGQGEDGAVARQAYGAVVFVALVVGIPLVTISGAIAYGMKRVPDARQDGRPRPRPPYRR